MEQECSSDRLVVCQLSSCSVAEPNLGARVLTRESQSVTPGDGEGKCRVNRRRQGRGSGELDLLGLKRPQLPHGFQGTRGGLWGARSAHGRFF